MNTQHDWENCKENVLPARRGRKIKNILKVKEPETKSARDTKLKEQMAQFELKIVRIFFYSEFALTSLQ